MSPVSLPRHPAVAYLYFVRRNAAYYLMIKVTAIPTGKAWLKSAQKCGGEGRSAFQRKLDIFRDKTWAGPLDIFAWLIEHPEGRFIIDTGDSAENSTLATCRGGIHFLPNRSAFAWLLMKKSVLA